MFSFFGFHGTAVFVALCSGVSPTSDVGLFILHQGDCRDFPEPRPMVLSLQRSNSHQGPQLLSWGHDSCRGGRKAQGQVEGIPGDSKVVKVYSEKFDKLVIHSIQFCMISRKYKLQRIVLLGKLDHLYQNKARLQCTGLTSYCNGWRVNRGVIKVTSRGDSVLQINV